LPIGRQINFYLTDADQEILLRNLHERFDIRVVSQPVKGEKLLIESLTDHLKWVPGQHQLLLFKNSEHERIRFCFRPGAEHIGRFADLSESPVISFLQCVTTNHELLRGRFYYIPAFDDFNPWAQKLFRYVRRQLIRIETTSLMGEEAAELRKLGYGLVQR
jgi:hypothetical protein